MRWLMGVAEVACRQRQAVINSTTSCVKVTKGGGGASDRIATTHTQKSTLKQARNYWPRWAEMVVVGLHESMRVTSSFTASEATDAAGNRHRGRQVNSHPQSQITQLKPRAVLHTSAVFSLSSRFHISSTSAFHRTAESLVDERRKALSSPFFLSETRTQPSRFPSTVVSGRGEPQTEAIN